MSPISYFVCASDVYRHRPPGLHPDGHRELFPRPHRPTRHPGDHVARLHAAALGRRSRGYRTDLRRLLQEREFPVALHQHDPHQHDRQQDVHHGAHDEHLEALPLRLRKELVRLAGPRVIRRFAGHLDVAAERYRADAILGVPPAEPHQLGPEAQGERDHTDADPTGHQEVAQFVHEDQHAQHEDKRDSGQ
jgi:hypothetical protein